MAADKENVFKKVTQRHKTAAKAETSEPIEPKRKSLGKSSDPDYRQIGVYCHKDVYRKAKAKIAMEELEFSQLIEDLLKKWVDEN